MKTNLDSMFKTDKALEDNGVEFALNEETSFTIRRFVSSNPKMKSAMAQFHKPYARQIEMGTLPQEKSDEIMMNLFVRACLVAWKGVEFDGKQVECNEENAMKLFKQNPALFDTLFKYANDFQNYKEELGNF